MSRTLVALIALSALSTAGALAAEPRKVWTAAEVIAVSGGTPAEISAAETALAATAQAGAAKNKGKAKKAATRKPKGKSRKAAPKRARARPGR